MKPQFDVVLTYWKPGFRAYGARRALMITHRLAGAAVSLRIHSHIDLRRNGAEVTEVSDVAVRR
jgi:hypothetical protein